MRWIRHAARAIALAVSVLGTVFGGLVKPVTDLGGTVAHELGETQRTAIEARSAEEIARLETTQRLNAGVATWRPRAMHALRWYTIAYGASALLSLILLTIGAARGWPGIDRDSVLWIVEIWAWLGGGLVWVVGTTWLGYSPFRSIERASRGGGIGDVLGGIFGPRDREPRYDDGYTPVERRPGSARYQADRAGIDPRRRPREPETPTEHIDLGEAPPTLRNRSGRREGATPVKRRERPNRPTFPSAQFGREILRDEGYMLEIYPDPVHGDSVPTAGVGHRITETDHGYHGQPIGTPVPAAQVREWLKSDLRTAMHDALAVIPGFARLPAEAQLVCANLAFQLGRDRLRGFTGFVRAIGGQDYARAALELLWRDPDDTSRGPTPLYTQTPKRTRDRAERLRQLSLTEANPT